MSLAHLDGEFHFNKEAYTKTNTTKSDFSVCYFSPIGSNYLFAVHFFKDTLHKGAFGRQKKSHCAILTQTKEASPLWLYRMKGFTHWSFSENYIYCFSVFFPEDIYS